MTGSGEIGATVEVRTVVGGPVIGSAEVGLNGTYSATLTPAQDDGQTLIVTQTDAASNMSLATVIQAPDFAPAAPTAVLNAAGTEVSGTGEAGSTVQVRNAANVVLGTATVQPGGSYTATLSAPQVDGQVLSVTQSDPGGVSPPATVTALDQFAPAAPTATLNGTGTIVTGTGEAGSAIEVRSAANVLLGTATVQPNGTYSATLSAAQVDGQVLSVTQSDPGGVSPPATVTALDQFAPAAPTATLNGTGTIVTGTGEAGSAIEVRSAANVVLGTATVQPNGTYSATLSAAQVDGEVLLVTQSDPGGVSAPASVTALDQFAPPAPTASINTAGTTVSGTGEAGSSIEVRNAGGIIGTGSVAANGTYSVTLNTPQTAGQPLTVSQADAGGRSPTTPVTAPFDIDAFDNVDTAGVITGPPTAVTSGSAFYTAVVGLVGLNVQVLSIPTIPITVAAGHTQHLTFVLDALANINALGTPQIAIQRLEGGQWVSFTGSTSAPTLLGVSLNGGNLQATVDLPAGQYRAFAVDQGAVGVTLLATLSKTGTDSTLSAAIADGNVITDPGPGGVVDIVNAGTVVHSVTFNGVEQIFSGSTTVTGAHGSLSINANGSYVYTPTAVTAGVGTSDVFTYTLQSPSGELESATLTINIQSGAPAVAQAQAFSVMADDDVVSLSAFSGDNSQHQTTQRAESTGEPAYDLLEGQGGSVEDVLQGYLDTMVSSEPDVPGSAGGEQHVAAADPVAPVEDPLAYLAVLTTHPNDELSHQSNMV